MLDLATVFSLVSWPGKYGEDTSRLDQISTDVGNCGDIGGKPQLEPTRNLEKSSKNYSKYFAASRSQTR